MSSLAAVGRPGPRDRATFPSLFSFFFSNSLQDLCPCSSISQTQFNTSEKQTRCLTSITPACSSIGVHLQPTPPDGRCRQDSSSSPASCPPSPLFLLSSFPLISHFRSASTLALTDLSPSPFTAVPLRLACPVVGRRPPTLAPANAAQRCSPVHSCCLCCCTIRGRDR